MTAVRPARAGTRKTAKTPPPMQYKHFPAPNAGLVLSGSLSEPVPRSAVVMNNAFPTLRGVRVRGGSQTFATIGAFPVESLFSYEVGASSKFFATGNGKIFDITAPADPDVAPDPEVSDQTEDYYSTTPFSTAGGDYLYIVNGVDSPLLYDGTDFTAITGASSPAITGVTTSGLSQVFSYKSRLFFIEGGTFKFWYLGVDSISGGANSFSLAGVFKKGGALLFGATWSQDAGDGLDDKLVLVTTLGEVAIYEGTNPASDFRLVGRYEISPPLGKNAYTSAGGDLVIMTQSGMVPISEAVRRERSVLDLAAISRNIEPLWKESVPLRTLPWEIIELPVLNMGVVSQPNTGSQPGQALVVNLQTSAWGVYTGWDTRCVGKFAENGYFGTNDGTVMRMEAGGDDNGIPYVFQCALTPDDLGAPSLQKTVKMGRSTFLAYQNINPQVSASINFDVDWPTPPNAGADAGADSLWDSAIWDAALWDGGLSVASRTKWQSVGVSGFSVSPQVQGTIANDLQVKAEFVGIDISYVSGGLHV